MSILTGQEIQNRISSREIEIDPYDPRRVQPNSIDLTLGKEVRVYTGVSGMDLETVGLVDSSLKASRRIGPRPGVELDSRKRNETIPLGMDESGWVVVPGVLYLMHTAERIHTKKFVTQLNGKSSIARLGVIVHFTAAYGDTGFNGQYTLEVSAMHPVRLYPGMAIAQAVFYTVEGHTTDYAAMGNYTGEAAMGAQPSRSWKQFK